MFRRFRFSLRWVLIFFAVFSVLLFFFVRPTLIAKRLVASIEKEDLTELASIHENGRTILDDLHSYDKKYSYESAYVGARIDPFSLGSAFRFSRSVTVIFSFPKEGISRSQDRKTYVFHLAAGIREFDVVDREQFKTQRIDRIDPTAI